MIKEIKSGKRKLNPIFKKIWSMILTIAFSYLTLAMMLEIIGIDLLGFYK